MSGMPFAYSMLAAPIFVGAPLVTLKIQLMFHPSTARARMPELLASRSLLGPTGKMKVPLVLKLCCRWPACSV